MDSDPNGPPSPPPPLPGTAEELLPFVYGELRRLAASRMAQESPGMTIQATALVHEAWMRLEREQKSTLATSLGVRPAAHRSKRGSANRYLYRARRNSARMRACSVGEISTIVGLGTETPPDL